MLFVYEDREYLLNPGDTLETDLGVLEVPEDVEPGDTVETHLGTAFTARALRGPDLFHNFERTGAPMLPRDIGILIGETGVCTSDRVLDAGTGTGVLAAYLALAGADVVTFEKEAEFADVARANMDLGGVSDRVTVRTGNLLDSMDDLESNFDVLSLDTQDAPEIIEDGSSVLVQGGYLAAYTPFVEHTRAVNEAANKVGLSEVTTVETIQREMDFDDRGSRPSTAPVGHSGYLTFARRT